MYILPFQIDCEAIQIEFSPNNDLIINAKNVNKKVKDLNASLLLKLNLYVD